MLQWQSRQQKISRYICINQQITRVLSKYTKLAIFTDRVRSTTGRLCFDTCPSVCPQGGTPIRSRQMEYPHPALDGGVPASLDGGYPLVQGWMGVPPSRGYPPWTGQQMEYLTRRGRFASCVHAGGLSCGLKYLRRG